jgi:PAS domain S-box-containing protein
VRSEANPKIMVFQILVSVAAADLVASIIISLLGIGGGGTDLFVHVFLLMAVTIPLFYATVGKGIAGQARAVREAASEASLQGTINRVATAAFQGDMDVLVRKTAEETYRLLDLSRCVVRLFEKTGERAVEVRSPAVPPAEAVFRSLQPPEYWKDAYGPGKTLVAVNVRESALPSAVKDALEQAEARAVVGIPLCRPEGVTGMVFLCRKEPYSWSEEEVRTAAAVGAQLATAVAHLQDYQAQRELGDNFNSLLNHVPGMVYRGHRDWSMSFISAEVKEICGYTAADFLNGTVSWKDLIHPEDIEALKLAFRNAVNCGKKVLRVEYRIRHRNGTARWVADRRQLVYDENWRFAYVDGICLNITDRKKVEEESRKVVPAFR